jgi:hypothetical protein
MVQTGFGIVPNRQSLVARQGTHDKIDLLAFDQLARFLLRNVRAAQGPFYAQLDPPACDFAAVIDGQLDASHAVLTQDGKWAK